MTSAAPTTGRRRALAIAAGGAVVLLTGCSAAQQPTVEDVATTFEDPAADPETRCDLLAPKTLAAMEKDGSCTEAVEQLSLDGGEVIAVEIWGGEAQVRFDGDTVFLTETSAGWRVVAAACQARGDAPYDCEVEGS
ncbi:hypothetical protein E4P40_05530 [Blastococcus sp. CT_GayMR20]|uniref:hypothetical protein n=1 Tax=Blastococcus sp. CT_GayMR20 TaxID=2559609 RepID=UPI0010743E6E|nr:hypothetical protein [Blastococcus sp. CT_GayMR20]TFV91620.1 hypothetical protein E4P40_05530 [Blastococcus sp. CT_GayMR20]